MKKANLLMSRAQIPLYPRDEHYLIDYLNNMIYVEILGIWLHPCVSILKRHVDKNKRSYNFFSYFLKVFTSKSMLQLNVIKKYYYNIYGPIFSLLHFNNWFHVFVWKLRWLCQVNQSLQDITKRRRRTITKLTTYTILLFKKSWELLWLRIHWQILISALQGVLNGHVLLLLCCPLSHLNIKVYVLFMILFISYYEISFNLGSNKYCFINTIM